MAINLMHALREWGTDVCILSMTEYVGKELNVLSLVVYRGENRKSTLRKFCKSHNVETIINFTYENINILPTGVSIRNICVFHWSVKGYERSLYDIAANKSFPLCILSGIKLKMQYQHLHQLIKKIDLSVALTHSGRNEILGLAPGAKVDVIPNFLPYDKDSDVISSQNNRQAVFVGRLSREKGVYYLLDIWEKVTRRISDVELVIYGDGTELDNMKRQIAYRQIPRIRLCGFESDARKIYNGADILLCTSETEGFGMVLIEAMYFGVVPIAFNCPVSPKELIADCGATVPCFNTAKYAETVIELFDDHKSRKELSMKGVRRASLFLKQNIIRKWQEIID